MGRREDQDNAVVARRGTGSQPVAPRLQNSVAALAVQSEILLSCLFSDAQLSETGLGPDEFIANAQPGSVFVSHTTGTVATLEALRDGSPLVPVILDAPVSGPAEDIAAGTPTVLVGGPVDRR